MASLIDLLSGDEVKRIDACPYAGDHRHPAWTAIHAGDTDIDYERAPKDYLVNDSVCLISQMDDGPKWLEGVKKRIAQTSDFEDCAAALAEIRCYGAMLEAGFAVRPLPTASTPTPDFEYQLGEQAGIVEVATKREHDDQVDRARQIAAGDLPEGSQRSTFETSSQKIDIVTAQMHPFGAPDPYKAGDTTQTNAISRICQIKGRETQIDRNRTSILWIDFRDLGWWSGMLSVTDAYPLISCYRGSLTSGAIWYAFYGWKQAPVLEGHGPYTKSITPLGHDGRFNRDSPNQSWYSAAVICLDRVTVLFENLGARNPVPEGIRIGLSRIPWFDVAHSVAEWRTDDVRWSIKLARSMIERLSIAVPPEY